MSFFIKEQEGRSPELKVGRVVLVSLIVLFGLYGFFASWTTVGAGERGVVLELKKVTGETLGEGLHFKTPYVDKIVKINVKTQKVEVPADAASRDLQTVSATVALNYHISPESAARLWQEVGKDYDPVIIAPALQESVKAATAQFTAEELITRRPEVRDAIKTLLKEKIEPRGLVVDDFNIINFDFSNSFNASIEAKVTAEQDALAAKNRLEQVKFEAEQEIARAEGRAEAIRVEAEALRNNPAVLELRAVERWNGELPQYMGGNGPLPFLNLR